MINDLIIILHSILLVLLIIVIPVSAYKLGIKFKDHQVIGILLYVLIVLVSVSLFILNLLFIYNIS